MSFPEALPKPPSMHVRGRQGLGQITDRLDSVLRRSYAVATIVLDYNNIFKLEQGLHGGILSAADALRNGSIRTLP